MNKRALFLGLSLLSSSAFADYKTQVDFDYTSHTSDTITLEGTYYFDGVSTLNTPWAEAAFTGRSNHVAASYSDFEYGASNLIVEGDYNFDNFLVGLGLSYFDNDVAGSDTNLLLEFGYYVGKNWIVSADSSTDDFGDNLRINTKYITPLSNGTFLNAEVSYLNWDNDIKGAVDYYFSAKSSVGLTLTTESNQGFGIRGQHFFTPAISASIEYQAQDVDDAITFGVTGRF